MSTLNGDTKILSLLIFLPAAGVFIEFAIFSQPERGLLAAYSVAVILTTLCIKWRLRRKLCFGL